MSSPLHERLTRPAASMFAITKSDTDALPKVARQIYVGSAGDVVLKDIEGNVVTHKGASAGSYLGPFQITHVMSATTAADLVGYA